MKRRRLTVPDYVRGILAGERAVLARAITLVESSHPAHRAMADEVLAGIMPHTGGAHRIGISGVPGVGKSTFLERFGLDLIERGHKVAVLAVDPTSSVTGGSILGDKTRMVKLSTHRQAYVRPSPTGGTLGGVHRKSRETMLLCEAAGFDVVCVETVGVGQSETTVADMVDVFLVLMLSGAGDELQGIKKGILEVADVLAVNKADGDNARKAQAARREYQGALRVVRRKDDWWTPPVLTCSGLTGEGLDELWEALQAHREAAIEAGAFEGRREEQQRRWMWDLVEEGLLRAFRDDAAVARALPALEAGVKAGRVPAGAAATELLALFLTGSNGEDRA